MVRPAAGSLDIQHNVRGVTTTRCLLIDVVSDDEEGESCCYSYVRLLGFHPYKEVIFLCNEGIYSSGLSFGQLKASMFRANIPGRNLQPWRS
jgi:hypothetical protein